MGTHRARTRLARVAVVAAALVAGALAAPSCGRVDPPRDAAVIDTGARDQTTDRGATADATSGGDAMACPGECLRPITCCRSDCSGPPVNRGCCPCHADEVDSLSCPAALTCAPAP